MKVPTYPRCSIPSRAKWLGEIPDHWDVMRLKFIFPRLFSGVSVNSYNSPSLDGSIAILKTSCVYGNRFNPEENKRVIETDIDRVACPVTRDSLVISRMNTPELVGNCGYVDRDYENLFLPDRLWIARFSNHPHVNGKFTWYLVISHALASLTGALATGTSDSMKNLTQEAFLDICVGVPTIPEQEQIAAFLDWKTGQIDALIARKQELLQKLKEKRLAIITQAVTRGLNPAASMRDSGVPWLGHVPRHWKTNRLRYCAGIVTSGSRGWAQYFADTGALFLRITNLDRESIELLLEDIQRVDPPGGAEGARTLTKPGDLLISITADLGSVAVIPPALEAAYVSQHLSLVRLDTTAIDPSWIAYSIFSHAGQFQLRMAGYGGTKVQLSLSDIKEVGFCHPPTLEEQQEILDFIRAQTKRIEDLIDLTSRAIDRLTIYRTAVITAATTGKIDVRKISIPA